jgi:hypothetical protein
MIESLYIVKSKNLRLTHAGVVESHRSLRLNKLGNLLKIVKEKTALFSKRYGAVSKKHPG